LSLIESTGVDRADPIIDIGGGASLLVDHLLDRGYTDVTVLDISPAALECAARRIGSRSDGVSWIEADATKRRLERRYQLWHDRAAFHFLIDTAARDRYIERLSDSVAVGGHAILATFALDGPERCSGLEVQRYGSESLTRTLGADFEPVAFAEETHRTPGGVPQQFLYGHFQRRTGQAS
jgi:SAM-dependent methyltransferase